MVVARRIARAVTAVVISGVVSVASAVTVSQPALAADGCSGKLLQTRNMKDNGGRVIAKLHLYWDGTRNCAVLRATSASVATKKTMSVTLLTCARSAKGKRTCDPRIGRAYDGGQFTYYAGPVRLNGVNKCVAASGTFRKVRNPAIRPPEAHPQYTVATSPYVGHCG
ncbi:hypothetical protein ABGB14_12825 [Nonomuraea sp. B10E15]